jgi:hypothetical protein
MVQSVNLVYIYTSYKFFHEGKKGEREKGREQYLKTEEKM